MRITVSLILALMPLLLSAQQGPSSGVMDDVIQEAVLQHQTSIVEHRHQIHQHPELGNREFKTAKRVAAHLESLGIEVRTGIAHTGVLGILRGGKPGSVVAVRADMDALPVTEQTDLPFKSTVRTVYNDLDVGVMHACGHDIHTSVLMGVAAVLADLRDEIPGTVVFIFQPAEEGSPPGEEGGADLMLEEGVFENPRPESVFGLHSSATLKVGQVGYSIGPALAAVDSFSATVKGQQSHGAKPHEGIDPVVMAAQVVLAFQTIPSRTLDPLQPAVVTVGMIHGGERPNIIPMAVRMQGTVRTYDPEVRETIEERMNEILDGIARASGGSYALQYRNGPNATMNNPALSRWMVPTLRSALGEANVIEQPPTMGAEDFSLYAEVVPGFFYFLGTHRDGTEAGPIHSPTFRADDGAVAVGMRAMSNVVVDYLIRRAEGDQP